LNALTLCQVPDTRENRLARVRQGFRLRDRFIGPSQVFLTFRLVCCTQFQSQQTSRHRSGDILNHYATPAIYEVREFVEVGGL
jgi:hypothetical protein